MVADITKETQTKMNKSLESFKTGLLKVRTGRAHTGLLDQVMVDYYGTLTALPQVANLTLIDSRTIGVQPWEKTMTAKIEKAIRDSDLGLNPSAVGDMVRVPMPPLSEERRRDLAKLVRNEAEDARVSVRNIRRDANNELKLRLKRKEISEDEDRRAQEDIQKLTDQFIDDIDKILEEKEKEVMKI